MKPGYQFLHPLGLGTMDMTSVAIPFVLAKEEMWVVMASNAVGSNPATSNVVLARMAG